MTEHTATCNVLQDLLPWQIMWFDLLFFFIDTHFHIQYLAKIFAFDDIHQSIRFAF